MTAGSRAATLAAAAVILLAGCGPRTRATPEQASTVGKKPLVPVEAALEAVDALVPGDPVRFRLTMTSSMDAPNASVTFLLPKGAAVSEGAASWNGALKEGETRVMELTVTVPGANRYGVSADIVLVEGKGTRLMKRVSVQVGTPAEKAPAATGPGHRHRGVSREEFLKNR